MRYREKFNANYPNNVYANYTAFDVINDKVMYEDGYYHEKRSIEDQIKQCVQVIGELMDHLGIDASMFNDTFIKAE